MKKHFKLLALILSLCLALPLLVACNVNDTENRSEASLEGTSETSIEELINIPKTDYGEDFLMLVNPDTNKFHYHWVKESSNDVMTEAVYARQEKVREHLGVSMFAEARNDPNYDSKFKTAVKNKDGSVDFMLSHVNTSTAALVTGGFLTDFRKMESINLDADYWNLEFMEQIALTDSLYFGRSDYNILYTYVVVFNKEMLAQYGDQLDESVYEMVDNYHWTLDRLISLAELVYIDKTADGKTEDDTFGISGEQCIYCGDFLAKIKNSSHLIWLPIR